MGVSAVSPRRTVCTSLPQPSGSRVLSQRAGTDTLSQPQRNIRWGGSRLLLPFGKRTSRGLGRCPRVMLKWGEGAGAEFSRGSESLPRAQGPIVVARALGGCDAGSDRPTFPGSP